MLLMGIIHALSQEFKANTPRVSIMLSYFFCDHTNPRLSSATSVLKGLLYLMLEQDPYLEIILLQRYKNAGRESFEDHNSFNALSAIFRDILGTTRYHKFILIVDGVDECIEDREQLLDLISQNTGERVHWIISSRHRTEIEEQLQVTSGLLHLNLEGKSSYISTAVEYLHRRADGTFLWVANICKALETAPRRGAMTTLTTMPDGLKLTYQQILGQVRSWNNIQDAEICLRILSSMITVSGPVQLSELAVFAAIPSEYSRSEDPQGVGAIIRLATYSSRRNS